MDNNLVVLDALTKACSQNTEHLKDAERQLKGWETLPGFYSLLIDMAFNRSLAVNIRWLSVLYAKNGIDIYWRCSISEEEKVYIKQKLMCSLEEPINPIAVQLAVLISRIARQDFPEGWQDLFPTLIEGIQSSNELYQLRSLLILHHVTKALASKRLLYHKEIFEQLTATIFSTVYQQWTNLCTLFFEAMQVDYAKSKEFLEKSLLNLKILRKLIVYGFKDFTRNTDAVLFLNYIFQHFKHFCECRSRINAADLMFEVCEKYIVLFIKVLRNVLEAQPYSFVKFIQPTLECCVTFCFNKDYTGYLYESLIVQFFNLVKEILQRPEYKTPKPRRDQDARELLSDEATKVINDFFTVPVLNEICQQLIYKYFLLSRNDLHIWETNPEEFASDEAGECWKYNLRPCTEVFFLNLFRQFRNLVTPIVVEIIKNEQNCTPRDFRSILKKEAVYNAVGLAAFDLYDEMDFESLFTSVLIPELKVTTNRYYILRRRVIWLIGQWVSVKISSELRPLLYDVTLQVLGNESEDIVVRLAASNTLKLAIDDFEFNSETFRPFLECSITSLFILLKKVTACDLKMSLLHVLSFIIERMGKEVEPYVESLLHYLPALWNGSGDFNMLRCAIITCFVQLVKSLGKASEPLHLSYLEFISFSTDISQPHHVYLLEDGLELWWTILQNTTVSSPELLNLASNLLPLLDFNTESLYICLQITEAYIVLYRENFLRRYGQDIVKTLHSAISDLKSEAINKILKVVETAFIVFPNDAPLLFQPLLYFALNQALTPYELPLSLTIYLSLLSRVILHNQSCFVSILQEKATELQTDVNTVLGQLFDVWLEKMPLLHPLPKRKLMGIALTCLLTSGSEIVHDRICGIYLAIVEVINDVTKHNSDEDMMVFVQVGPEQRSDIYGENKDEENVTEHERRMLDLLNVDPVHTVVLRNYFNNQLTALEQSVGTAKFQDLMSTVDVETMQEITRLFGNVKV